MSGADPAVLRAEAWRWLRAVEDDLDMVAAGLERGRPRPAAFHVQQAAEKLLKILLVLAGATVPKTHDLERLIGLAGVAGHLPAGAADDLAALTSWVTIGRYPEPEDEIVPNAEEIAEARALLRPLEALVRAHLSG
jgi:HEPN domain-containing protein